MQIEIVTKADDELYTAFQRLIPQLTDNHPAPGLEDLMALIREPGTTVLIARNGDGVIAGALSLTVYRVPTGIRSIIEDVIVDHGARGAGMGEALMTRAIELAREQGAAHISLTSNPARGAANRLYLRMGFKKRETNSYLMKL